MSAPLIHGTCVRVQDQGVLLMGVSGSGKSDLALRLMDRGAILVGDDYLESEARGQELWVRPTPRLAGLIEVRNIGLCPMPHCPEARVHLVIQLDETPERLPERRETRIAGIDLPWLSLNAYEASAPLKVELALQQRGLIL